MRLGGWRGIAIAAGTALALTAAGAASPAAAAVPVADGPQVSATPTTGLGWRTDVEVRISDATPGDRWSISQCFDDDEGDADCVRLGTTRVTDAGKARHVVSVRRLVLGEEDGGDCWRDRTTCWLDAYGAVGGSYARVPLTFDPTTPPPPPPRVDLTPGANLAARATVRASITGLLGDERASLEECAPADAGRPCAPVGGGVADSGGRLTMPVTLTRLVGGFPYDCATSAEPCVLRVTHESGVTDVPLSFDPASPPPPGPELVAAPTTGLFTDDRIVAVGHGFTADWLVAMGECVTGVTDISQCDTGNVAFASPHDGSFLASIAARPTLRTAEGPVDCRVAPGCVLTAVTFSSFAQTAVVPLTFAVSDLPSLTIHDGIATEGTGEVRAEVTLSAPSASTITVKYVTHHDSARAGSDYLRKRSRLIFRPGETRHVVRVALVDDRVRELTEHFRVDVDSAAGAHVSDGSATLTITDDD